MEIKKELGKIKSVSVGNCRGRGYLFGITFELSFGGSGCVTSKQVNMSEKTENCKWTIEEQNESIVELAWYIRHLLKDAKVNDVSELNNMPIEATFKNRNMLESFRILTEVL